MLEFSALARWLFYSDNLEALRRYLPDGSVDLIYLDPPFNSAKNYAAPMERPGIQRDDRCETRAAHRRGTLALERAPSECPPEARGQPRGKPPGRQGRRRELMAFTDTWRWSPAQEESYQEVVKRGGRLGSVLCALRTCMGESDLLAYLTMMSLRLTELARVMKPTASLFLHCAPNASHYLKLLLDALLGAENFRNEVVWRYRRWPTRSRQFQKMHDVLLFYSRSASPNRTFHVLYGYEPLAASTVETFGTRRQRADFSSGHRKPGTLKEITPGPPLSDVWEVGIIAPIGKERCGYPTQKPEALLERIIRATTDVGAVVLDPFCGSGTTLVVAERLQRSWIGIDSTELALGAVKRRFLRAFGTALSVVGEPRSVSEAGALARENPHEYVWWALGSLGAEPEGGSFARGESILGRLVVPASGAASERVEHWVVAAPPRAATASDLSNLSARVAERRAAGGILIVLDRHGVSSLAARAGVPLEVLPVRELVTGKRTMRPTSPLTAESK